MSEKKLLNETMTAHTKNGGRIFRNNVGVGWAGKFKRRFENGDVLIGNARPLNSGLCVGSSDLIGWSPLLISDSMVGSTVAVFTALEAKTKKLKTTEVQENFLKQVIRCGGFAAVIRSVDDYEKEMELWKAHSL